MSWTTGTCSYSRVEFERLGLLPIIDFIDCFQFI